MKIFPTPSPRRSGFSLIEMLVVLVVIVIIASLSVPLLNGVKGANNLTYFSDDFLATLQAARQRASSSGKNVALRLYKIKTPDGQAEAYRSMQLWEQKDPTQDPSTTGTAWVALGKRTNFRRGIIALDSPSFSTLLSVSTDTETINGTPTPFSIIIFTPAGRVDLPSTKNFITFVEETNKTQGPISGLPANFVTFSIEPFNARPFLFRP